MKPPMWNQLLIDVEREFPACSTKGAKLTIAQVEQLQAVENANDNFQISILHGVAAIGELIANAANRNELSDEVAMSAGWLINSLALLSMSMADADAAAAYKLQNIPHQGVAKP